MSLVTGVSKGPTDIEAFSQSHSVSAFKKIEMQKKEMSSTK